MPTIMSSPGLLRARSKTTMRTGTGDTVVVPCEPYYDYKQGSQRYSQVGQVASAGGSSSPAIGSGGTTIPRSASPNLGRSSAPPNRPSSPGARSTSSSGRQIRRTGVKSSSCLNLCCFSSSKLAQEEDYDGNGVRTDDHPRQEQSSLSEKPSKPHSKPGPTGPTSQIPSSRVPTIKHAFSSTDIPSVSSVSNSTFFSSTTLSGGTSYGTRTTNTTPSIPTSISDLDLDAIMELEATSTSPGADSNPGTSRSPLSTTTYTSSTATGSGTTGTRSSTNTSTPFNPYPSSSATQRNRANIITRVPGYYTTESITARPVSSGTAISHGVNTGSNTNRYSRHVRFDKDTEEGSGSENEEREQGGQRQQQGEEEAGVEQRRKKRSPLMLLMKRGVSRF